MVAPDDPDQRRDQHHHPGIDRHHRTGHMQIDDLHCRSLPVIIRRQEEPPDQPGDQRGEKRGHGRERTGRWRISCKINLAGRVKRMIKPALELAGIKNGVGGVPLVGAANNP